MIDVHEILRRSRAGESARKIARATAIDRKTVGRYLDAASIILPSMDSELTDELIVAIKEEVQARPEFGVSAKTGVLQEHRDRIKTWLNDKEKPLRLTRILELLARDGVNVSYTTLRRFAHQEFGFGKKATTVLVEDAGPAEEAQVDFGLMGKVVFEGVERKLWVFIVTLVHSRYSFVWPTFTQTREDVIAALEAAWRFFDGVCARVIPDNATSIVIYPDRLEPILAREILEYSQHRKFFIDPARVECPQDKARVENHVAYVRERWYDGETFSSLSHARECAALWCRETAGMRIHGTTQKRPFEVFESVEKSLLRPIETDIYEVARWVEVKVARDHHFQVDKALYSAPTAHIGAKVEVRIGKTTITAYRNDKVIAAHDRALPGERRTNAEHYPPHKKLYATRNVEGVIAEAAKRGPHVEFYARKLLDGEFAWMKMRQAHALLGLCDRYGSTLIDRACEVAISYDVYDVPRLQKQVRSANKLEVRATDHGKLVVLPGRFARAPERFATMAPTSTMPETGGEPS